MKIYIIGGSGRGRHFLRESFLKILDFGITLDFRKRMSLISALTDTQ